MENLRVTEGMRQNLLSAMKWTKFLAIVCTIGVCLIVLIAVAAFVVPSTVFNVIDKGNELDAMGAGFAGSLLGVIYLVIALLYIYPLKKVFAMVKNTREAMNGSQPSFEEAADNYACLVKYMGILTIIALVIYALILIMAIIATVFVSSTM